MLSIALIAAALGLSNFAASIALGLAGVDNRLRRDIAVIFGLFEAAMPLIGLMLGRRVADTLGAVSSRVGGGLLIVTGVYAFVQARRPDGVLRAPRRRGALILTGAALSLDNLVAGVALGATKVPVVLAATLIAVVSVALSLVGLEVGARLGHSIERRSGELGALVLVLVGAAIAAGFM